MYNKKWMYKAALAKALPIGPRKVIANGKQVCAYVLFRSELVELYEDHNFAPEDRITWLKHICAWDQYGVWVPTNNPEKLRDNISNWCVLFGTIDRDHWQTVRKMAEDENCYRFPEEPEGLSS